MLSCNVISIPGHRERGVGSGKKANYIPFFVANLWNKKEIKCEILTFEVITEVLTSHQYSVGIYSQLFF
jgi:hypothetical protein